VVTMSDVARLAGVSTMTVSNVVNDRSGVSDAVRERVRRAIAESGYRMNVSARNLRSGASGVIGLAVPELNRPYFGALAARVTQWARKYGYRVVVEETGARVEGEIAAIQLSHALDYDGLLLSPVGLDLERELVRAGSRPLVVLGERPAPSGYDHVALPNSEGTEAVTRLLLERGARRVALVRGRSGSGEDMLSLRHKGYRRALDAAGLTAAPELLLEVGPLDMASGREAAHRALDSGLDVDAFFAVTDTVAFGVIRGLADRGVRVPDDVLVAGFDDLEESEYFVPSLTSVSPDLDWTAQHAVELLLARVRDEGGPSGRIVAPFDVVERESTRGR